MREYYDQWEAFSGTLSRGARLKEATRRRLMWTADRYLLTRQVRKLFVISGTVQRRLATMGIASTVLHPPPPPRPYRCDDYEPWLFAVSRFTPLKRMPLIAEALAQPAAAGIRCVLAGEGADLETVARVIAHHGLGDRVVLAGRLDDTSLVDHLARCRGVVFVPFDEDYGFVTVEAFASAKPVITTIDSGGPAELVRHDVNGLVATPDPASVAAAMRRLIDDRPAAQRLGEQARQTAAGLSWSAAVAQLMVPLH
jgi:glycosyltransferase involved in cell wall biosynthesis